MLDPGVLLLIIAAVIGSGATVAAFSWMLGRIRRVEASLRLSAQDTLLSIHERLDYAIDEIERLSASVGRLEEQVDFTSRLLERPVPSETAGHDRTEGRHPETPTTSEREPPEL